MNRIVPKRVWLVGMALLALLTFAQQATLAFTPESPEVKKMVDRAIGYLEKANGPHMHRVGEKALVALAIMKARGPEHPMVKAAYNEFMGTSFSGDNLNVYEHGIVVIFMSEMIVSLNDNDSGKIAQLQKVLDKLIKRQKKHGGFGYDGIGDNGGDRPTGDVSQSQYAALGMWSAVQAGAVVPPTAIKGLCEWFLRVQDPDGGWPYQGLDPGSKQRIPQTSGNGTLSRTAAGLGSVCVFADVLGMHMEGNEDDGGAAVPSSLKLVKEAKKVEAATGDGTVEFEWVNSAIRDGTGWFAKHYSIEADNWNYYYIYGLERCESFRELFNRRFVKEPRWYNDGVAYLAKKQHAEGHWESNQGEEGHRVSTSFCVLFLSRSARKSIAKKHKDLGDGVLTSGKGLPTNLANVSVRQGKLVDTPFAGEVSDLVAMLEDPDNPELLRLAEEGAALKLDADLTKRQSQIEKLRAKVSSPQWESRMLAVRTLGKSRDLDSVPLLLYALTDPDKNVVREADAALRFVSRKFRGVGLPVEFTEGDLHAAKKAWKEWFLAIRPDAQLLD